MSSTTTLRSLSCLRPYQIAASDQLYSRDAAILLLKMGGGKTIITVDALIGLQDEITRTLVVAPKAVAVNTWGQLNDEWDTGLTIAVAVGTAAQRSAAVESTSDILVINYDNLQWLAREYPAARFDVVVMDEITRFNSGGKRFRAFRPILDRARIRWGLTGTLAAGHLKQMFYPVLAVDGGAHLGTSYTRFLKATCTKGPFDFDWTPLPGAAEAVAEQVQPIVIRPDPAAYEAQLPPVVRQTHTYTLGRDGRSAYHALSQEYVAVVGDEAIDVASGGVLVNKLAQCASGFLYDEEGFALRFDDARLDLLSELLAEAAGEPVLVWYWFEETRDQLLARGYLDLVDNLEAWNRGDVPVAICHPRSGGHGINAQHGGRRMIWFEHTWSSEERQQAEARLHRSGQQSTVYIHDIVGPEIDGAMQMKREGKLTMEQAIARALAGPHSHTTKPTHEHGGV